MKCSTFDLFNSIYNLTKSSLPNEKPATLRLLTFGKIFSLLHNKSREFQLDVFSSCLAISKTSDEKAFILQRLIKTNPEYKNLKNTFFELLSVFPDSHIASAEDLADLLKDTNYHLRGAFIEDFSLNNSLNSNSTTPSALILENASRCHPTIKDLQNESIRLLAENGNISIETLKKIIGDSLTSACEMEIFRTIHGQAIEKFSKDYTKVYSLKNTTEVSIKSYKNYDEYFSNLFVPNTLARALRNYKTNETFENPYID